MSGKAKRRREARRRARQRHAEQMAEPPQEEGAEEAAGPSEEEPARTAAATEARHSRAARKRAKRRDGLWERVGRVHVSPWLIATPVVAIGVGIVAVLVLTSGSSGTTGGVSPSPTPDARVAGLPIDESFEIVADDDGPSNPAATSSFEPNTLTANAGEVIEIELKNEGSVTHNIWVAGADNDYDTADDWGPIDLIGTGETGRLVVKIDEPGTYLFRCQIHPEVQIGELILE